MTQLDQADLAIELVIIDNNSSDHTKQIVEQFTARLPLRYLFESRPGKNCALNKALGEVILGEIIVFTDDDVEPSQNWLTEINRTSSRWPEYDVFGGKITLVWPESEVPAWTSLPSIRQVYGIHDLGSTECSYVRWRYPFGANYWVRRSVFASGRRFDEGIGPHPKKRSMGSEASFLRQLALEGYHMLYCPGVVVGHHIHTEMLSPKGIRKRVYGIGRGRVSRKGIWRNDVYNRSKGFWFILSFVFLLKHIIRYGRSQIFLSSTRRMERSLGPISDISYIVESLKSLAQRSCLFRERIKQNAQAK